MHHTTHTIDLPAGPPLHLGRRALIMGILNVTPDSFSDGGRHSHVEAALAHARSMLDQGADIIDVGGESTRPGAERIGVQEELDRVMPVIDALRAADIGAPLSIDTSKPLVADQAIQAGATLINDVRGLQGAPEMAEIAALYQTPVIAMHWDDSWDEATAPLAAMSAYFERTRAMAKAAGLAPDKLVLDPGFGFNKTLEQNYLILRHLAEFKDEFADFGLLVGTSRKSMIGKVLGTEVSARLNGTLATSVQGYERGGHIFRVHDVGAHREALRIAEATLYGP